MLALFGVQANAQTSYKSNDVKVWADNVMMTADNSTVGYLNIYMTDLTRQYAGFQMEINVPKGIHINKVASARSTKYDTTLNQYRFDGLGHTVTINMPSETVIRLSVIDYTTNAEFYSDAVIEGKSDVNNDGILSMADLTCITDYLNGNSLKTTKDAADVNGDGVVNLTDVECEEGALIETIEKLINIGLVADETMADGTYDVSFTTAEMITKDAIGYQPAKTVTCKIIVNNGSNESSNVKSINNLDSSEEVYGIDGVKRSAAKSGINIIKSESTVSKVLEK